MDGSRRGNPLRRADWTGTNAASDATQKGQPTQQGQPTRQTEPRSVIERLSGQPADGARRTATFGTGGSAPTPYDQLDSQSQRLSGYGFSQNEMNAMGTNEVLGKVAEIWPQIKLHSPVGNLRALVVGVAKKEGSAGLQALLDMALKADTAGLTKKAEEIRGAD